MVFPGCFAGRIIIVPEPSQVDVFAPLDHPVFVIRPKSAKVPILRPVGLLRYIIGLWSRLAKMPGLPGLNSSNVSLKHLGLMGAGVKSLEVVVVRLLSLLRNITRLRSPLENMPELNSGRVSLDRLVFTRAGPKSSEVGILCLLGLLGLIMLFRRIEPPGVHLGNVSLVLITAIAKRVLPLQTQSNVLRRGLGAPSLLEKRPIITVYPDLVYTESCLRALRGLAILFLRFRRGLIVMYIGAVSYGGRGEVGSRRWRGARSRCRCCGPPS